MTMMMVTHKVPVMKMCDRILVVAEGRVVEEGTYEELMEMRGVFAQLASGGEWQGDISFYLSYIPLAFSLYSIFRSFRIIRDISTWGWISDDELW
ncbi:hypothetical protein K435DRAFT_974854, partial [Dendrothele bispora CBS 962.96]